MARGIVIIDKPAGWTSQDVVAKLRGVFHEKRIGHGGTLDPMATGVLPVFVGRATRCVEFFEHADKAYKATLRLGTVTDTQDITGTVLETRPVTVTREQLEETLKSFVGFQMQTPPMYSAVKVDGKRLYDLARRGQTVARQPREIRILDLELRDFDGTDANIFVHCSKGTYVRTLCADIGAALGCGGTMAALRRVKAGAFPLAEAHPLEALISAPDPAVYLLKEDLLFRDLPAYTCTAAEEKRLRNGAEIPSRLSPGKWRVYGPDGSFLLLGQVEEHRLKTIKNFFEVK